MKKRILAVVLAMIVLFCSAVPPGFAEAAKTEYAVKYEAYRRSLCDRCVEFQGYMEETGQKQFGLLYQMRVLSQYMLYTDFMITYMKDSELQCGSEAQMFEIDLKKRVDAFNKAFNVKSSDFKKCKLNDDFEGQRTVNTAADDKVHQRSKKAFEDSLCKKVPAYLKELLKGIQDDITQAKGDGAKIQKIKDDNTTLICNIYAVYTGVMDSLSDLQAYTPFDKNGKHKKFKVEGLEDAFNNAVKDYDDLIKIAKQVEANEETSEEITVNLTKPYVDNLSDAVTVSGGRVEFPKNPNLTLLYYAIMAASSVYVPLQSYAGSSEFQAALKSLTNDDQMQIKMTEFYSSVKDIRKPLYKREFDEKGIPTGTAKILTIQDFLDDAKSGKSGALCTILGKFRYDSTANSWLYEQDDQRTNVDTDYEDVEGNGKLEITEDDSEDDNEVTTLDSGAGGNGGTDDTDGTDDTGDDTATPAPTATPAATKKPGLLQNILNGLQSLPNVFAVKASATSVSPNPNASSSATPDPNASSSSSGSGGTTATDNNMIDDIAVFAFDEVTDDTKISEALYMYGSDYIRDIDNMTSMLMHNILASSSNLQYIADKRTRYLYVNPFGDIVTDDNLIVFPGIANPLLYKDNENYNPYTAAFMNTYPGCYKKSKAFRMSSKRDIGKYLIVKQGKDGTSEAEGYYAALTKSVDSIKVTDPLKMRPLHLQFSVDGAAKNELLQYTRLMFGSDAEWNKKNEFYCYTPLIRSITAKVNESYIFPYVMAEDPKFDVAKAIAKNMYLYLTTDSKTGKQGSASRFNDNFIVHYFITNGLGGTNNPKGFSQNTLEQYNKFVANAPERFMSNVKGLCNDIVNFTSSVQGVIGLREFTQNGLVGRLLVFFRTNLLFFFLIVSVFLLIIFARMRIGLFQMCIKLFACLMVAYMSITLVPTYLPMVFNVAINQVSENLTYKILALRSESDDITDEPEDLNDDGSSKFNSESITLYRAGVLNYEEFVNSVNTDEEELVGGNSVIINQSAGLFAEGDSIKINTNRLFRNLRIKGKDTGTNGTIAYKLKAYKTVSDNVDYYNPFYTIVDSFITELNKFEKVYEIPRSTITYSNGVIKDNFLVYSFANSPVFLAPGKYNLKEYTEELTADVAGEMKKENTALAEELTKVFGDENKSSDFLRLSDWLASPSSATKKTLWYKTMVKNHFYNTDGSVNTKKMDNLVKHVNDTTKRFIFSMDDQVGRISDETMIKLIALRATIDFNQQISDFGTWVYPFSLNYGDFTLKDVVGCIFVSDYAKYSDMNFNVIDYVGDQKGWFTLIITCITVVLLFVITCIVQFLVPLLYVLLCITVIMKLLAQGDAKVPVKGFLKCSLILMISYTFFALALIIAEKTRGGTIGVYAVLGMCLLVLYILFVVVSSLVANFSDLGNATINARITSIGQNGIFNTVKNLSVTRLVNRGRDSVSRRARRANRTQASHSVYRYDSSVNDQYSGSSAGSSHGGGSPGKISGRGQTKIEFRD